MQLSPMCGCPFGLAILSTHGSLYIAFYLGIYAAIAVALGFFTFGRLFILARFGVLASNKLRRDLLASILRAMQASLVFLSTIQYL
jgi:hypothetical protein